MKVLQCFFSNSLNQEYTYFGLWWNISSWYDMISKATSFFISPLLLKVTTAFKSLSSETFIGVMMLKFEYFTLENIFKKDYAIEICLCMIHTNWYIKTKVFLWMQWCIESKNWSKFNFRAVRYIKVNILKKDYAMKTCLECWYVKIIRPQRFSWIQ